jgi:hypothetical protein
MTQDIGQSCVVYGSCCGTPTMIVPCYNHVLEPDPCYLCPKKLNDM